MSLLPVETWSYLLKFHLHSEEWRALSTTSSFFRQIAQEALYESVTLRSRFSPDADCVENLRLERFVRSLAERPELALLIRSLNIWNGGWMHLGGPRLLGSHRDHPVLRNLATFSLLRQLTLGGVMIDHELCSVLHSLPRLTNVRFRSCRSSPEARLMQAHPESSISTMIIDEPVRWYGEVDAPWARAWAMVVPVQVRSLTFSPRRLDSFDALLSCLAVRGGTTQLTSLTFFSLRALPPSILNILISSPQLRSFSLPDTPLTSANIHPLDSLPMDAIPLLEEFTGPANLCATLIRGRPVQSVKLILNGNTPVNVLTALQLSTVPVTRIELAGSVVARPYLTYAPVSTVYFCWSKFISDDEAATALSSVALARLTNLRIIRGMLWTFGATAKEKRPERATFVKTCSEICPSLREFDFIQERWLMRKDTSWERFYST